MPTLELFTPATHPDGWRQVRAPGGYECWHLLAVDTESKIRFTAGLWLGHPHDPAYTRKYHLYRFCPTRFTPPVPSDFPSLAVEVVVQGRMVHRFISPAHGFEAATDRCDVRIGNVRLNQLADGAFKLSQEESTELLFRGAAGGETIDGAHHAIMVARGCVVEGNLKLPRVILPFSGTGLHGHFFGTRYLVDERQLLAHDR